MSFIILGCASNDDCTKMITIPELIITTPTGSSYNPAYDIEVPCDYEIPVIEETFKELDKFSYEVLSFKFTPDTGKNTSRLQFEIKLNNNNNVNVIGVPIITVDVDGTVSSGNFASGSTSPCQGISANSSCTITYDKETTLDLGLIKSIKIVTVKYMVAK